MFKVDDASHLTRAISQSSKSGNSVKDSLELLSKRWRIDPEIYDLLIMIIY
jgi:hypothetical protein